MVYAWWSVHPNCRTLKKTRKKKKGWRKRSVSEEKVEKKLEQKCVESGCRGLLVCMCSCDKARETWKTPAALLHSTCSAVNKNVGMQRSASCVGVAPALLKKFSPYAIWAVFPAGFCGVLRTMCVNESFQKRLRGILTVFPHCRFLLLGRWRKEVEYIK